MDAGRQHPYGQPLTVGQSLETGWLRAWIHIVRVAEPILPLPTFGAFLTQLRVCWRHVPPLFACSTCRQRTLGFGNKLVIHHPTRSEQRVGRVDPIAAIFKPLVENGLQPFPVLIVLG